MKRPIPVVLSIAGSDSSGGAGLQRDVLTCASLKVHCVTAVTAITAQDERGVQHIHWTPRDSLVAQIRAAFQSFDIKAIKIGMLGNSELIQAVKLILEKQAIQPPVILDPIIAPSSGLSFWEDCTQAELESKLFPLTTLLTPNLNEAAQLSGCEASDLDAIFHWATHAPFAVLLKGGHADGPHSTDRLFFEHEVITWHHKRNVGPDVRGTGCALSTAIAAKMALGIPLQKAAHEAVQWLQVARTVYRLIGASHFLGEPE